MNCEWTTSSETWKLKVQEYKWKTSTVLTVFPPSFFCRFPSMYFSPLTLSFPFSISMQSCSYQTESSFINLQFLFQLNEKNEEQNIVCSCFFAINLIPSVSINY